MTEQEIYALMSDCPEIQDGWEPMVGDLTDKGIVTRVHDKKSFCTIEDHPGVELFYYRNELIYLPRQGQLQDMIVDYDCFKDSSITILTKKLYEFSLYNNINHLFTSIRQLWLAFVMWELHSKRWEEGKWKDS